MTKPIILHEEASKEFLEAEDYYFQQHPSLANEFKIEITRVIANVADRPKSYVKYLSGTRRSMADRFPYFVVFKEYRKAILVVAVAHVRREPGYWRERLK
ncbi:MAG TPA: type II toxin-antitoxin system RelE/ParE family toxin [Tepidisphaeraceae bacterium]|nr:type II toxin-antitoxin system RelE/ParE family toxin [Tepidisphaeraceae bacterium]